MPQRSAGILLYRRRAGSIEMLLVHPGGPFWARKDEGAWSIPKGGYEPGEDPLAAAKREFAEETGAQVRGEPIALGSFRQSTAKTVAVWAVEGEFDPATLESNTFAMEWPPRSGRMIEVPEVDRAAWFTPEAAGHKILKGQRPVIEALLRHLEGAKERRQPDQPPFGHAAGEDEGMQSFVIGLSSHRGCRDLFWHLATIAPVLLVLLPGFLFSTRFRRAAALGLACCAVGAFLFALLFHHTYALGIWSGHASAIRYLDQTALMAGFAASAVAYACALSLYAGVMRLARRT